MLKQVEHVRVEDHFFCITFCKILNSGVGIFLYIDVNYPNEKYFNLWCEVNVPTARAITVTSL